MRTPLIAVGGYRLPGGRGSGWDVSAIATPEYSLGAVRRGGGTPVIVSGPEGNGLIDSFDALLLVGGGDVEPERYGAQPHPEVYGTDPRRDEFELDLVRKAIAGERPLLAISRAIQVVNVALGRPLPPHLADMPCSIPHGFPTGQSPWVEDQPKGWESTRT